MLHALGILIRTKHGDLSVSATEGLHALESLNAVIEARGHAVDGEVRGDDEARSGPGPAAGVREGRLDVAVDFADFEAYVGPI